MPRPLPKPPPKDPPKAPVPLVPPPSVPPNPPPNPEPNPPPNPPPRPVVGAVEPPKALGACCCCEPRRLNGVFCVCVCVVLDPNPDPKTLFPPPNVDPPNAGAAVDVDVFVPPSPPKGPAVDVFKAVGLEAVGPPKNDPVPAPAPAPFAAVPFAADIPRFPNAGGFFLLEPDNPSRAGWFGLMLVDGSRVGLFGGAGRLSADPRPDAVPVHQQTYTGQTLVPNKDMPRSLDTRDQQSLQGPQSLQKGVAYVRNTLYEP